MSSDNVAEQVKLHQETIASDSNSPLQMIREKELEISGRMLSAKRNADEVVANARKQAAEIVARAEAESGGGAKANSERIAADAAEEARSLREDAERQAETLREAIGARIDQAVDLVVDAVKA